MPIKFNIVQKKNPLKDNAIIYHAKTISNGSIEFEELLQILAKKSRLHYVDCLRVLLLLDETLKEQLQDGKIVRLGDMGSFQIGASSSSFNEKSKVTAATITKPHVNFRAGKSLQKMLKELEFKMGKR